MTDLHEGRVVWVTGAASGIGRATVEEILEEGGSAVGSDLPESDLSWAEGDERIAVVAGDVADPDHNDAAVNTALERFGRLDGAVLNAGIAQRDDLFGESMELFEFYF